ncbi:hypothetical protein MMC27_006635 [Xylographa pallens]|nr:hypothetical protein [Xylographa pallens]
MASSNDSKYDVSWYLDQLQQPRSNLSNELSALVELHDMTSLDVWRESQNAPPIAKFLQPPRIKNAVETYLQDGAGIVFWPAHSLDPFFEQLQWPDEADKKKITALVLGLTCLKIFHREKNYNYAVRNADNADGHDNLTNAGRGHTALATAGNPTAQAPTGNIHLVGTHRNVQGEGKHRRRARIMLETAELSAVSCIRCIAVRRNCYRTQTRKTCVYCTSRGLRISDCKPAQTNAPTPLHAQAGTSTLNAAQVASPLNVVERFRGLELPSQHESSSYVDLQTVSSTRIKEEEMSD